VRQSEFRLDQELSFAEQKFHVEPQSPGKAGTRVPRDMEATLSLRKMLVVVIMVAMYCLSIRTLFDLWTRGGYILSTIIRLPKLV